MEKIIKQLVDLSYEIKDFVIDNKLARSGQYTEFSNENNKIFGVFLTNDAQASVSFWTDDCKTNVETRHWYPNITMPTTITTEILTEIYTKTRADFEQFKVDNIGKLEAEKESKRLETIRELKEQLRKLENNNK